MAPPAMSGGGGGAGGDGNDRQVVDRRGDLNGGRWIGSEEIESEKLGERLSIPR